MSVVACTQARISYNLSIFFGELTSVVACTQARISYNSFACKAFVFKGLQAKFFKIIRAVGAVEGLVFAFFPKKSAFGRTACLWW
jgi:hypothetical protein